jgi:hypothetical protein
MLSEGLLMLEIGAVQFFHDPLVEIVSGLVLKYQKSPRSIVNERYPAPCPTSGKLAVKCAYAAPDSLKPPPIPFRKERSELCMAELHKPVPCDRPVEAVLLYLIASHNQAFARLYYAPETKMVGAEM